MYDPPLTPTYERIGRYDPSYHRGMIGYMYGIWRMAGFVGWRFTRSMIDSLIPVFAGRIYVWEFFTVISRRPKRKDEFVEVMGRVFISNLAKIYFMRLYYL